MNYGRQFSVPDEPLCYWIPATPQKPAVLVQLEGSNSVVDPLVRGDFPKLYVGQTQNFNGVAQMQEGGNVGYFSVDGSLAWKNQDDNARSLVEDLADWNSNISFTDLLQNGNETVVPSGNNSLSRHLEMAANQPLRPRLQPEFVNWGSNGFEMGSSSNGNGGSNGFELGSGSIGGSNGFELGSGLNGFELGSSSNGTLVERPYGDNLWIDLNSSNDTLQSEQNQCQSSNLQTNGNISQTLPYGLQSRSNLSYDLNSSPGEETDSFTKVAHSLQFTLIKPHQGTQLDNQNPALLQSRVDDSTSQGKDGAGNLITYGKVIEHRDELSHNVVDSSSNVVSLPSAEKKDSDKRVLEGGIDLNKTPAQKPAKRKKHRPKVVVEGKPKRTPKPAIPRNGDPKENRAKRKYVRKKKDSTTQQVNIPRGTTDLNNETAPKNSRRNLEIDLENIRDQNLGTIVAPREEVQQSNQRAPNTTMDLQAREHCGGTNYVSETMPVGQRGMPERWQMVNRETGSTSNSIPSMNQLPNGYIPPTGREAPGTPLPASVVMQMKNFYANGRHGSDRITDQHHRTEHVSTPIQQHTQAKVRGSKRANCHTSEQAHLCTTNSMGWSPGKGIFQMSECQRNSCTQSIEFSQAHKRNKIGNGMLSNITAAKGTGNGPVQIAHNVNREGLESPLSSARSNSYTGSHNFSKEVNYLVNKITTKGYVHSNASGYNSPRQRIPSEPHSLTERMGCTRPLRSLHSYSSQTTVDKSNHLQPSPLVNSTGAGNSQLYQTYCDSISAKKKTEGSSVLKPVLYGVEQVLQQNRSSKNQQPTPKRKGRTKKQTRAITVDDIICLFKALNLNRITNEIQNQDHNAIVPYKGLGAVVPYNESEFLKKRKARPKVDLDPETNRIWNLLMGKEESEDTEGTDKAKEKWWENERNVFRGRVDSFIARMHLVQGDRRFSQWKGSVVDSVIGVFLTQNVSDHLSSSAFMSLAARFPLKPSNHDTHDKVETNILAKEPEIFMLNPNDKIKWPDVSCQSTSNPSITRYESGEHHWGSETSRTGITLVEAQSQRLEEVFVLSQDSVDSSITQVSGVIKSCTGSNSEAEDPCTGHKPRNAQALSSTGLTQTQNTTRDGKVYGHITGFSVLNGKVNHLGYPSSFTSPNNPEYLHMQVHDACLRDNELHMTIKSGVPAVGCFEAYSDESISSWSSTTSRSTKGKDESYRSLTEGLAGNSGDSSLQQNSLWMSQETPTDLHVISANSTHQGISQAYRIGYNQSYSNCYQNVSHLESTSFKEPAENAESLNKMQNATVENVPNVSELTEKNSEAGDSNSVVHKQMPKEQSSVESNGDTNAKTSKAKKGNSESKKKNSVDWDYLRRQVETNGREKERSKEAMDSLDYEAVRLANVHEISQAIKERGMNNMLAERIKEFLNRLVRDHGSIDLEWLRDVPPDKAKDFLLSIRGLGLKSVECVRLLTLHNLAFPVDTNVGRIAVRLGWVPLQPLPESLQLHLLEMYPILESIQKYLWPRLCKLDQRTLYELHYQMITFGKVFCTKHKPNCNACPMRGECRHFASAFASARLALPGPEEKSSTGPLVANNVPLPPPENKSPNEPLHPPENISLNEAVREIGNCEPIIEEPATPEQEFTEISQTDIEDLYEEDPDEIPTIKLDIKEFTVNIQNYMQGNMDLQEADMSKALVALNPEATIPMPKLKNISRLRTEHQVYELPDSHPLLEGRDKREPDDPSPYLLAIWTPGETATMIQPPEGSCTSKEENKLCNEKTCFSCNSVREARSQTVRGTILIPCRTAMRGSFPLNGTYFQVNEMFADHDSSLNPINVPREWIWNLPRRMVYFGTSVTSIFKGLSTEGIQFCFWRGFVCVRGFDQTTRAPKPLLARLHFPTSKLVKKKDDSK